MKMPSVQKVSKLQASVRVQWRLLSCVSNSVAAPDFGPSPSPAPVNPRVPSASAQSDDEPSAVAGVHASSQALVCLPGWVEGRPGMASTLKGLVATLAVAGVAPSREVLRGNSAIRDLRRLPRGAEAFENRAGDFWDSRKAGAIGRAGGIRSRGPGTSARGLSARGFHDASLAGERAPVADSERHSEETTSERKSLKLLSAVCNLPHPDKAKTGGEDAYFICAEEHAFGVADGVGGWSDLGIDAGEYARELMSQASIAVGQKPPGCADPAHVLERAHSLTKCRGSSTACILALTDETLEAASLGDSGFVVVRDCHKVFKSPSQQHLFNIPYQLENGGSDPPSAAQVFSLQVCVGDVIVTGTDGLFDNLYDSELTKLVVQAIRGGTGPEATAQKIAALARSRAQDKNRQTPFSTAAQDAGFRFYGGKMDDITVIVSYVTNGHLRPLTA